MDPPPNEQSDDTTNDSLQFDLEMDTITETSVFYSPRKSLRGRRRKILDGRTQSQTSLLKSNYININVEQKMSPKFRPIWPKPYQSSFLNRPKIFGLPSSMNEFSSVNPGSRIIVTTSIPSKEKLQDYPILNKPIKRMRNYSKSATGGFNGFKFFMKENDDEKNYVKNNAISRKGYNFIKMQDRNNKDSIELFFESMARTVLSLPMHVQAEIKMEICKLVAMEEIKYSFTLTKYDRKIDFRY